MGAPAGNQNAAKAKIWSAAIKRALENRKPLDERKKVIDELAEKLIDSCYEQDLAALKEFGDRVDGKVPQAIVGDDEHDPITVKELVIRAIDATSNRPSEEG